MKNFTATILLALIACFSAQAQFNVGIRDTRYVYAGYTWDKKFSVQLEHSIYSEKMQYQYVRLYAGYQHTFFDNLSFKVSPYYGMTWNNNYRNGGVLFDLSYNYKRAGVYGILNPHYDSTFHYETMFRLGAKFDITRQIAVCADYNTIPVYRQSEKSVRAGFDFKVKNLSVSPMLSIPVAGNQKLNYVSVLLSFNYVFGE